MNFNNNYLLLLILIALTMLVVLMSNTLLNTEELTYNFYSEQLAQKQIEKLIESQKKWEWVVYAIVPLVILIRSSLVAMCLSIGLFFYDDENEYSFKKLLNITLWGEFVFVLVSYVKFIYFGLIKTDYSLKELQQFFPLSITNFLNIEELEAWFVYPLQMINVFEVIYLFVLVDGLYKLMKNQYKKSFEVTAVSYGIGLLIWLGTMSFLVLSIT